MTRPPTIVLVHGALSDASVWAEVAPRLTAQSSVVLAPAIPLRGLETDAAYLSAFLDTIHGPLVLVGHSYGGTVISHPTLAKADIKALVYISAFAPESGESSIALNTRWSGSKLGDDAVLTRSYPGGTDLYLRSERFAEVYADDLPSAKVEILALTQRPIDVAALAASFEGEPLWRRVPSWMLISTKDASLPVEAQRFMAQRAQATTREVACSHATPLAQPAETANLILLAVAHVADVNRRED
jgi:pimeloyl-ACP methyl ester carboxylesterase